MNGNIWQSENQIEDEDNQWNFDPSGVATNDQLNGQDMPDDNDMDMEKELRVTFLNKFMIMPI
jgi:hypothetical protein